MPTKPILLDETGKDMVDLMRQQNALLQVIASEKSAALFSDVKEIQRIVRSGNAPYYFNPGDKIIVPWKDVAADVTYDVPFNVVHRGYATLKNGDIVPGLYLQWHYATPFGIQFDNYEAFFYAETELPAGTYYITVGANWGTYCKAGETYSFTLTQPVPAGGQLAGFYNMPDKSSDNWKVYSFASAYDMTPIETVSVTAGANGTSLGTFIPTGDETTNSIQRVAYGYDRWSHSAIRQNLNSAEPVGKWWNPQNVYDRAPDQLKTKAGFLSGFNEDFLSCLGEVKVITALNTVTDGGGLEETYDKFFLPSLEQMHITPQISGEGEMWEYWRLASESASPLVYSTPYPQMVTYALENHASPQSVRLRSANRGAASTAWGVYSSGGVTTYYAYDAHRCAPACVIC